MTRFFQNAVYVFFYKSRWKSFWDSLLTKGHFIRITNVFCARILNLLPAVHASRLAGKRRFQLIHEGLAVESESVN